MQQPRVPRAWTNICVQNIMTSRYQLTNRIVADILRCVSSDCGHSILFLAVSFLASSFLAEKQHINMEAAELQLTKVNHSCLMLMNVC